MLTLLQVGCLMMRQIMMVNWRYIGDAIPAFVTVMFIPFGYSAAYGLIAGLMTYTALNGLIYLTKLVSGGRIVPEDEDHREYWTSELPVCMQVIAHHADIYPTSQTSRQTPVVFDRFSKSCRPRSRAPKR